MKRSEWTAGDDNVVRLLAQSYDPPTASAAFAARVQARLLDVAAERAQMHSVKPRRKRWVALAAVLAFLALGVRWLPQPAVPPPMESERQLSAAPRTPPVALGTRIATKSGERRRIALADGSVLSLNENTVIHHDALRHLLLQTGEVFVEVAPQHLGKTAAPFTVATPHRKVQAVGTKFVVRTGDEGTGVAVAQGHVRLNDWDAPLSAGQQLKPQAKAVTPTPRLTHLLAWTRDLVVADSPSLVPVSAYTGGALVTVDPQGKNASLSLRKYHIDVHIEDGFARTTIDQTYFNHTLGRLEGTFYFPLPADASLSRLAIYVDGQLMEGGMVERDYGRIVFDQIVSKMKDPALLEWVDGHTFKMRVFPLEARQEKRIILSYTQRLANLYGRSTYRFPAAHSLGTVNEWSFHAVIKNGGQCAWHCDSHTLKPRVDANNDLLLDASAQAEALNRDLVLNCVGQAFQPDSSRQAGKPDLHNDTVSFNTMTQDGFRYLMLRYRPHLPGLAKRQRRDWVFLFESSAERDPLLARTQIEVVRTLLNNAEYDDTFVILTANTRVHAFAPAPLAATPENVTAALVFLEKAHLIGALDLDAALTATAERLNHGEHPVLVHLGSGNAVLGERRAEVLASRLPQRASYVGIGVGKRWNRAFMHRAAERCQGYVTEINPDEPVAWRAFDLLATLNTPHLTQVRVTDAEEKTHFLCPSSFVPQGEELCAICRLPADAPLPQSVCLSGSLDGLPFCEHVSLRSPRPDAAYLPRTWARLEVDRLLAEDAVKNKERIIALSKAMYVMTPYTSLLVLENEAMYAQYKVDRGRKDHWAMYPCPAKISVVYEPLAPNERIPMSATDRLKGSGSFDATPAPYTIHLEAPQIARVAIPVASDAQLRERIRQENRERNSLFFGGDGRPSSGLGSVSAPGGMGGTSLAAQFSGRSAATRWKLVEEMGDNHVSEAAVARGLQWLALHQADDGHWSACDFPHRARTKPLPHGKTFSCNCTGTDGKASDILATSAAVLPFLAAGITHRAMKTTNKDYQKTVAAALYYLIAHQKANGSWEGGSIVHALATIAVCEAYAMTHDPRLKMSAQPALNFLADEQSSSNGGRIAPPLKKGDLYTIGWTFLALKSGQMAELHVPRTSFRHFESLFGYFQVQEGYTNRRGEGASPTATALALLCRMYSGDGPKNRGLLSGVECLKALPPGKDTDIEYLFFATQVMFQMQDSDWQFWNEGKSSEGKRVHEGIRDHLLTLQDKGRAVSHSHQMGSWAPDVSSRLQGGRVVSTALSLLCLEIYYRHLPLYRQSFNHLPFPAFSLDEIEIKKADDVDKSEHRRPTWRQAALIAERNKNYKLALFYFNRAMQQEGSRPADLTSTRRDGAWFLRLAQHRVEELVDQQRVVPRNLLDAVVEVADSWRAVDPEDWRPCWLAGRILSLVDDRELTWSYLTSPLFLQNDNAGAWIELARQQYWQAECEFAERAYAVAASLEPNNAEIVRERASNRRRLAAMRQPERP